MKTSLLLSAAMLCAASISAQETVKSLYSGDPVDVSWATPLQISADLFSEDVNVGNYIQINLSNATDVLEIKADGQWLPGSRYTNIEGASEYKAYITADMLNKLKTYGLEIIGASFTVNSVDIMNDGFVMPEGAIWGGYFWVENWNTMELFKTAFDNYADQRYLDIYLSADNGDFTGYFMKVLTAWDNDDAIWANNEDITHTSTVATVDLDGINVAEALANYSSLMIQSNPEGGSAYNITAIALRNQYSGTANIEVLTDSSNAYSSTVYNLQGIAVMSNVTSVDALRNLPAGLYIFNGKKYAIR